MVWQRGLEIGYTDIMVNSYNIKTIKIVQQVIKKLINK